MTDILMPALSPTMEEGVLAKWTVKEGDMVKSGDIIAEIETDKATMEVEAVDEGVVDKLLVPAGTEGVKVNTPIARLRGEGDASARPADEPPKQEPKPRAEREEKTEAKAKAEAREGAPPAKDLDPAPMNQAEKAVPPDSSPPPRRDDGAARVFASPLARRIAQQKGIELSALKGSGPHGRIVKADLENASPAPPLRRSRPVSWRRRQHNAKSNRWSRWASPPAPTTSCRSMACERPSPGG